MTLHVFVILWVSLEVQKFTKKLHRIPFMFDYSLAVKFKCFPHASIQLILVLCLGGCCPMICHKYTDNLELDWMPWFQCFLDIMCEFQSQSSLFKLGHMLVFISLNMLNSESWSFIVYTRPSNSIYMTLGVDHK